MRRHTESSILEIAYPEPNSGCWLWSGYIMPNGYGVVNFNGRRWLAHRLVFTIERGRIPDGLEMDHLCRNRCCVNPDHLEPVERVVNVRRGSAFKNRDGMCRKCGGELSLRKDDTCADGVFRFCASCKNARNRDYMRGYYEKNREDILARSRASKRWKKEDPEKKRAAKARYLERNKDRLSAKRKAKWAANREECIAKQRAYRAARKAAS